MKRTHINLKAFIFIILTFFVTFHGLAQSPVVSDNKISLLFIGDIMGHDEQIWSAENRDTHEYNYDDVFSYIKPVLSEADIAIANFEVTLGGQPYTGYPQFSSPAALAVACRNAGIDYLVSANNHAADRGKRGIINTINRLDSIGIPHTGTFLNQACRDSLSPLMINRKGISFALLNYTYGTNGIVVPEPVIVNTLDKEQITSDIKKARSKNADVIILFLHWGNEYDTIPTQNQIDLADYFLSSGVDLVIGSHPHVLQKMIWVKNPMAKDGIVAYSLGNFVSNQRRAKTDGGSIIRVEMTREGSSVRITNAGYYLTWVYTPIEKYRKKFFILPCSIYEKQPEFFSTPAQFIQMKKFISNSRSLFSKQNIGIPEYIYNGTSWLQAN